MGRRLSDRHQELARQLGQAGGLLPVLTAHQKNHIHDQYGRGVSQPASESDQKQGRVRLRHDPGKTCIFGVYSN